MALLAIVGFSLGLLSLCRGAQMPTIEKNFLPSAKYIDLVKQTVTLPLYRAVLPSGATVFYLVTEASTADAARAWGVSYAPILAEAKDSAAVQRVKAVDGASKPTTVKPSQILQIPATVDFLRGKRSVTPNTITGFPPSKFSFSAQGDPGK